MKIRILFLMLFVANFSFSQSVDDYKAVVIPLKYDFQKSDNQYRLQTLTKIELQKAGFEAFYATESVLAQFPDRCSLLYVEVSKESGLLTTKLFIIFKDCYGTIVYQSPIGKSKEKEFDLAYAEALSQAFLNVYALNYKYSGNTNFSPKSGNVPQSMPVAIVPKAAENSIISTPQVSTPVVSTPAIPAVAAATIPKNEPKTIDHKSTSLLYAQPTSYGYQLIDSEPKVVMKVYKTSNPASFMAKKGEVQGALVSKDNQWFFEYYQNDQLISENIDVKF